MAENNSAEGVTRTLASYVVDAKLEAIPSDIKAKAITAMVNWVGCAVGGSGHETLDVAWAALGPFAGAPQASILGRDTKTDVLTAAFMNGLTSHVDDFDDTHLKTAIHPSGPVLGAILALAEHQTISGPDFLNAMILGIEVECRIGNAIHPEHYDIGWHITGTAGVFGGAAAAGKLLGLSVPEMCFAFGIAATQASGLRDVFGTMCKPFHVGHAAKNGLSAALLAKSGFTSSEGIIEAPRGFANVLSTKQDFAAITEGLGESFELATNSYKPFPCGVVIHPVLDGCLQLKQAHEFSAEEIKSVELKVHRLVLELTGNKEPRTDLEARFSIFHSAAVALERGRAGIAEYTNETVNDPAVIALRNRVSASIEPGIEQDQIDINITLEDGRVLNTFIEHAIGSKDNPMSNADIDIKTKVQCAPILGDAGVERMIATCRDTLNLASAAAIAESATPNTKAH
jgi:2-methylcitrate dehydratase PrpD